MVERKNLTNMEIYNLANLLLETMNNDNPTFPVKVNFYLQKNMSTIVEMAKEIEKTRIEIVNKFGHPVEGNEEQYEIGPENMEEANAELSDLFNLTQEVSLNMLKLDWFDGIDLTAAQVRAIAIMISEE